MSTPVETAPSNDQKPNDKEFNFRALEAKFQRQVEQERLEKDKLLREVEDLKHKMSSKHEEEDEYSEPYVDHKRLEKKLEKFEKKSKENTKADIEHAVQRAIYEERKNAYL